MPDITLLPLLAEIFGVTIDDLFDLTAEQRFNRMENRMDVEEELPQDVFWEYEEFLKSQLSEGKNQKRATDLIAYLYWHRMNTYAQKVRRFAKEAVRMAPNEKGCQWMLSMAEGHAVWDWNMANHTSAINFYKELVKAHPDSRLCCFYLLDNLIADHRVDEAEEALNRMRAMRDVNPIHMQVYKAHIALARYDEKEADGIMERLIKDHPDDSICLFEAAQYYARKCEYQKAIGFYERSFELTERRPRFQDALMGIADIYQIMGDYAGAAETYGRIVDLLKNEWGMTEDSELKQAQREQTRLLDMAKGQKKP